MSGEEGKTNDAVRGSSQPAELCHLLSGWRCSAPECPAQPGLPSTTLPPHPSLRAQILTLLLRPCSSRDVHPSQGELGVCPDPWPGDEKPRLILHLPSKISCLWPRAESQRVGFKKDQSSAEVSARPSFIQGKTFLILKAAWTTYHKGDALRLHQQEGSCAASAHTSTLGNASIYISKIWKNGPKRFLPEKSIKSTVTTAQETLQDCALGQTSRRKSTYRLHIQRCHAANTTHHHPAAQGACVFSVPLN